MQIRTSVNQIGLLVEARQLPGDKWQTVQLTRFADRTRAGFGKVASVFVSPAQDEADYLATIRARGIEFEHVRPTYADDGSLTER